MNPDRATLNFLNLFNDQAKDEGTALFNSGNVTQIFGNHLFIQGRVEDGNDIYRTSLRLQGNTWIGLCSSGNSNSPFLYATMLERMERGENLPEAPNEIGQKSLIEILEEKLKRELVDTEENFVSKLERRYRRYEMAQEFYDTDIVRLNPKWPLDSDNMDPLEIWPSPPSNIVDFWNYIAYAFEKKGLLYPEFLKCVTDLEATQERMRSWERQREIDAWQDRVDEISVLPPSDEVEQLEIRFMITTNEARLQLKGAMTQDAWETLQNKPDYNHLEERFREGGLELDGPSELIWKAFTEDELRAEALQMKLDKSENCQILNRLFQQEAVEGRLVNLDERPFIRMEGELRWVCREDEQSLAGGNFALQLITEMGEDVPHSLRILPGVNNLYISDEVIFAGPSDWTENTEVFPRYEIPQEVIDSQSGVEFLATLDAELPEQLRDRVEDKVLKVHLAMSLTKKATGAESEHLIVGVAATDEEDTRREVLEKEGWAVREQKKDMDKTDSLLRYDRRRLHRFPGVLEPMALTYDPNLDAFKTRVTKVFPHRFHKWLDSLPKDVEVTTEGELTTLMDEPVRATVKFDVKSREIDWFDLKIVVNIDGHELAEADIKKLVEARGDFVRMKDGGWMRLEIEMDEEQRTAVQRLGLDPFDLSGEEHRMHVLQLADPAAQDVFDKDTWESICDRVASLKLRVQPKVPDTLKVDLRPYQVEGFEFLAYLTENKFGGILADDMGLGKTVQSLTWLLWLRTNLPEGVHRPSIVICPKSVLDVWSNEVKKFAPSLRVKVLRSKEDLDVEEIKTSIDIFVLNYAQLRGREEKLKQIQWLAIVLDEGQQIKNPDSKAAKAARELVADNRLVLTGTPIENRLLDLWSLMAFAMPGVLGNRNYFRKRFDRRKDPQAQVRLAARLRPFLIRRTKDQVAVDLPPRTEEDVFCTMPEAQEALYDAELERIRKILLGIETDEALKKNSFVILQGLMRLRQICCDPALLKRENQEKVESAKLTALFYLLDQLHEEGHKCLVFSQFTSMLDIIKNRLESEDRPYTMLTGQTKNRADVIEKFQTSDEATVFLLSLKAGGSGLNLTSASYVILYDPWWNPAVENQAIDRTHRIGQKNKVIAYRLLVRNTVEEKIRVLQKQKNELVTGVLGEESFARNLEMKDMQFLFSRDEDD